MSEVIEKGKKNIKEKTKLIGSTVKGLAVNTGEKGGIVAQKSTETLEKSKEDVISSSWYFKIHI